MGRMRWLHQHAEICGDQFARASAIASLRWALEQRLGVAKRTLRDVPRQQYSIVGACETTIGFVADILQHLTRPLICQEFNADGSYNAIMIEEFSETENLQVEILQLIERLLLNEIARGQGVSSFREADKCDMIHLINAHVCSRF